MVRMARSTDREWKAHGACQRHPDPSVWFPERGENLKTIEAKRWCDVCVVKRTCLEHAVLTVQNFGIWGGCGEPGRRFLRRLNRACPHPGEGQQEGCSCDYCCTFEEHWTRLEVTAETGRGPSPAWNINGPGARHGTRACAKRGCDRPECRAALRRDEEVGAA